MMQTNGWVRPWLLMVSIAVLGCMATSAWATDSAESLERLYQQKQAQDAAKAKQSAVGKSFRDCPECPEMLRLPTGMAMGKYEVTQGQWRAVMGSNPSFFSSCGDGCPVEQVSWNDAQDYIERLNQRTGKRYRLPTEIEWFAACQAGSSHEYCGSDDIDAVAWYGSNSAGRTHPAGQKQANAWGLYDMSGNVWEWTSSCEVGYCSRRVFRGGSWGFGLAVVRSAFRSGLYPTHRYDFSGFRLAHD